MNKKIKETQPAKTKKASLSEALRKNLARRKKVKITKK
jgi:hypothetical protein